MITYCCPFYGAQPQRCHFLLCSMCTIAWTLTCLTLNVCREGREERGRIPSRHPPLSGPARDNIRKTTQSNRALLGLWIFIFFNSKNTYMFCPCIFNILQTSEVCPRLLTSFGKSHLEGGEIFGDYFNIVKKWQK